MVSSDRIAMKHNYLGLEMARLANGGGGRGIGNGGNPLDNLDSGGSNFMVGSPTPKGPLYFSRET